MTTKEQATTATKEEATATADFCASLRNGNKRTGNNGNKSRGDGNHRFLAMAIKRHTEAEQLHPRITVIRLPIVGQVLPGWICCLNQF
jgi:hypothetical protein